MEWSELGSRDIDGKAERPSERARASQWDSPTHWVAWNAYGAGPDEILWRGKPGSTLRYHQDIHGNVTALLDSSGNLVERYTYDAFGRPTILSPNNTPLANSGVGNRFMFQGRAYFPELGIYDYRHRFYDPYMGHFLQADPTGFDAGDMNLFRYCADDPVDRSDPTGLVASPTDILKPNLIITGQGDWAQLGSAFTNGDLQSMVRSYLGQLQSDVDSYVNKANEASQKAGGSATWSADYTNWLKDGKAFQNPRDVATTDFCTETGVFRKENGTVAGFNVNLHIDINWNNDRSGSFASAFRTDVFGPFDKTGEIEHARDGLRALARPYGGAPPAVAIANKEGASMVGQIMSAAEASKRMDASLAEWISRVRTQSWKDHDGNAQHSY
jgi:RHS repeat-associated protein